MAKEIVVNVGERETRIAVIEDGKLVELHIERAERVVGSLYKCRVSNVLQGMDAAFVDIGLERNAFLYVGDVLPGSDEYASTTNGDTSNATNGTDRRDRYPRDARSQRPKAQPGLNVEPPKIERTGTGLPAEVVAAGRAEVHPSPLRETGASFGTTDSFNKESAKDPSEDFADSAEASVGENSEPGEERQEGQTVGSNFPDINASATPAEEFAPSGERLKPLSNEIDSRELQNEANHSEANHSETPLAEANPEGTPFEAVSAEMLSNEETASSDRLDASTLETEAFGLKTDPDSFETENTAAGIEAEDLAEEGEDTDETDEGFAEEDEDGEDIEEELEEEAAGTEAVNGSERKSLRPKSGYRRSTLRQQRIKDVLRVGQELLVQVIKGPRSTKGARVSTRISLPGRYLVLMPEADNLGVSRKIEDSKERDRLKKIGEKIRVAGFGLIIRTEAEDKTEQELRQDMDFLVQNWRQVQENARNMNAPALVLQDLTLLYKTIRDVFGSDVSKLVIDDPAEYEKANELLDRISPKLKGRIQLYDGPVPIFDHYNMENEIERLTKRKVFLKSGGSLIIDETEALTVIDVNTSKNVGGSSLAETIVKTNIDAAAEIARQLRLRDIGGIIVIDFIDMNTQRDKQAVLKALEAALKKDRSRTKISNISPLGLVEMTRKRTGETLAGFMSDECPYCKGRGHLPSAESVSLLVERDLRRQINAQPNAKKDAFLIRCHPEVAEMLIGPEGATIEEIERQVQRALFVRADEDAHIEAYAVTAGDQSEFEKNKLNYRRAQVVECHIVRSLLKEANKCIGWADGYMLDLDDGNRFIGQKAKVRITDIRRSYAAGTIVPGTNKPLDAE